MKTLEIDKTEKHYAIDENRSLLMILRNPLHNYSEEKFSKSLELDYGYPDPEMNSLILKNELDPNRGASAYVIGITLAILSAFSYGMGVVFGKYAFRVNPSLTTFDINLVRGIISFFITLYQAKATNGSLTTYTKASIMILVPGGLLALMRSYSLVLAYKFISGTKSLLITNISPILIVILGGVFLHEEVHTSAYFLAILTGIGCYVLTLSKSDESVPNSNPTLGYIFAILSMLGKSMTAIFTRILSQILNYMVFPFIYSLTLLLFSLIVYMITNDQIHISEYSLRDTFWLSMTALSTTSGLILWSLAMKYINASTGAPISYLEIVFAFVADELVFNYSFYFTDLLGAFIILFSLGIQIFVQVKK